LVNRPPLFPVHLRDIPRLTLHEVSSETFQLGALHVSAAPVCHPGPTVGYRLATARATVTYLPDHEPALGVPHFPVAAEWTSGFALAEGADLLVHDAQYSGAEYPAHVGWGHSALEHTFVFAALARVGHLVTFHHDPAHGDDELDRLTADAVRAAHPSFRVTAGAEDAIFAV